ncbi:glycerophosphodiester phosphodiesterase family protein [Microbacterium sp. 18062]|uniref:glycerophosphodiester phosphodiesterase n=1 Tax=Microbacterium sp. 18062 TaxID=2681410 RepID=UPI0013583F04|nr:glycerophosphodiester phosphodiesterase family protein [Microbacterium sp. 18062]
MRSTPAPHGIPTLLTVGTLVAASLVVAALGSTPRAVGATEALGAVRSPGEQAFVASHRGGAVDAPENTLPAVAAAFDAGFAYVEVDVALSRDRVPVLLHDPTVDRTTDGTGAVADLTWAELARLDAGAWFSSSHAGTRIPRFEEFLDLVVVREGRALVELKGEWDAEAAASVVGAVEARGLDRSITVASFDARTLALVGAASTVLPRMMILRTLPDDIVVAASTAGVRGVIASRRAVLDRPEVVAELHDAGVRIAVYTLNSDDEWSEVTELGVDGIITDDPTGLERWQRTA